MYIAYTDGSCLGNPGPGGIGFVLLKDNNEIGRFSFSEEHTTNNRMELLASVSAISYIKEIYGYDSEIKIITDSNYVVQGMNTWRHNWKKTNWKGCKKNLDLWKSIDQLGDDCIFEWVKGHNKNHYNEIADTLATSAARNAKGM